MGRRATTKRISTPFRPWFVLAACLLVFGVGAPAWAAGESWRGELDRAVELAVAGKLEDSLAILARLEGAHPDEPEILRRTAQVMARSNRPAQAFQRFQRLKELAPDSFTDREQLLVLLLSNGDNARYEAERRELLAAFEAAGDRALTRSPHFVRELFAVGKTVNVDAYEFYPNGGDGPVTPYFLFVLTGDEGAVKGHFLVARDRDKTAALKEQGKLAADDGGYYLEYKRASGEAKLISLFKGDSPPSYEQSRAAVVAYVSERLKS